MAEMSRLNLGCADRYVDGWWNVDWAGSPHRKDETVDLTGRLPWPRLSIEEAYAGHLLEHLAYDDAVGLLRRLRPLMKPTGEVMVVGPDVDAARDMVEAGTFDYRYHSLESIEHGDLRWPGSSHRWYCTAKQVQEMLESTGWQDVVDVGIMNVPGKWPVIDRMQLWQLAVSARA